MRVLAWRTVAVCALALWGVCQAKAAYKVKCTEDTMQVEMVRENNSSEIYLENLKHYPDKACQADLEGSKATFRLPISDIYRCGVTRISNTLTNRRIYYHRVVVEGQEGVPKEVVLVKCILGSTNHTVHRRNVLPAGFQEPEDLEITTSLTEMAPPPVLSVGVRQAGKLITGELNVSPGTPLQMEVYLDKDSAPVYGLLVSYMQVSDTKSQEETIIFNGCSVDPYLFENFNTVDGDFLAAKFRAFKFPESTYVQFKGTVNVCLDKCQGVDCSSGQKGFGRRRREVTTAAADPNKIFVVTMSTFIKVDYLDDEAMEKGELDSSLILGRKKETRVTATSDDPGTGNNANNLGEDVEAAGPPSQNLKLSSGEVQEELQYTLITELDGQSGASPSPTTTATLATILLLMLLPVLLPHH